MLIEFFDHKFGLWPCHMVDWHLGSGSEGMRKVVSSHFAAWNDTKKENRCRCRTKEKLLPSRAPAKTKEKIRVTQKET